MWYWRQESFEGLKQVRAVIVQDETLRESLQDYALYLELREKGLRGEAFGRLRRFIVTTLAWPFERRKEFVGWLMEMQNRYPSMIDLVPHPLSVEVVKSTLEEWVQREPGDAAGYRWRGIGKAEEEALASFRRAIELDPGEQIARAAFVEMLARALDFATHEVPHGHAAYLGEAEADLVRLAEAQEIARGLTDEKQRRLWLGVVQAFERFIRCYLEHVASGDAGNYTDWARRHGKAEHISSMMHRHGYGAAQS